MTIECFDGYTHLSYQGCLVWGLGLDIMEEESRELDFVYKTFCVGATAIYILTPTENVPPRHVFNSQLPRRTAALEPEVEARRPNLASRISPCPTGRLQAFLNLFPGL